MDFWWIKVFINKLFTSWFLTSMFHDGGGDFWGANTWRRDWPLWLQMLGLWHSVYYWSPRVDVWQSTSLRFQRNEETRNVALFAAGAAWVASVITWLYYTSRFSTRCTYQRGVFYSRRTETVLTAVCSERHINPFNASCFKLLLFKGFSAVLV